MNTLAQTLQLALKCHQAGDLRQAEALYRQILQVDPRHADALHLIGLIAYQLGKNDLAVDYIRQAVFFRPQFTEAHCNLGAALMAQGQLDAAVASYQQALRLKPDYAEAHSNLGMVLRDQGKLDEAVAHYQQALRRKPDYAEAYNNLAIALQDQNKFEEAIANFQQALRVKPDFAQAHNNLGNVLKDQGRLEEAIASYRQALRLKPDFTTAYANLLVLLPYHPDYNSAALYQAARHWSELHAEPLAKYRQPHANPADPDRRLRIGYVSPDLRSHPVSYLFMPLLANHDHRQVEVFCYAEVLRPDGVTEKLRGCADVWRSTVGQSDEQMAGLVRQDRIDILVDLALHTGNNRLLVFARKPAPVQATWMVPGTSGLSSMDYRLTDPYLDPPGENPTCYAEQSIRLPDTFWCYDPMADGLEVNDLPALANGYVTFGCLNNFCKVNDGVLMLWAKALRAVPRSRLLLLAPRGHARDHVRALLTQQGIDEPRVEFIDRQPRRQYLQLYNQVDLSLDALPYNGHTTSLDAFWMGVPTITLIGQTVVGRVGWSQLCNLGLQELAARTPEEFAAIAANLAGDLPRLQDLRQTLRPRMVRSPLMDAPLFARNFEQCLRRMWHNWCRAAGPAKS